MPIVIAFINMGVPFDFYSTWKAVVYAYKSSLLMLYASEFRCVSSFAFFSAWPASKLDLLNLKFWLWVRFKWAQLERFRLKCPFQLSAFIILWLINSSAVALLAVHTSDIVLSYTFIS